MSLSTTEPARLAASLQQFYPQACIILELLGGHTNPDHGRFVGGVVRDLLLGKQAKDMDIATPHLPEEVMRRLQAARIHVIPTGIEHGTIMAIIEGKPVEITTLRQDIACDGRRATVAYTTDWQLDATRRDFTFNALSLSYQGQLFDYTNGQQDLASHMVRFIGNPEERIREDHLRILRYLRFLARFFSSAIDTHSFDACTALRSLLHSLSRERIRQEMLQFLCEPFVYEVIMLPQTRIICHEIMPAFDDLNPLKNLLAIDASAPALLRLSTLLANESDAMLVAERWRLSNKEASQLVFLCAPHPDELNEKYVKDWLVAQGQTLATQKLQRECALQGLAVPSSLYAITNEWAIPTFPLTGRDMVALGISPGKKMGQLLAAAEQYWKDSTYQLSKKILIEWIKNTYL